MDIKKLFVGGIVGGIVSFALSWLVYGILLMDFLQKHPGITVNFQRTPHPLFLYLIIGNLLFGFLLAYIFIKSNVTNLTSGLVTGGILGFLSSSSMDSVMYATTTLTSRTGVLADIAASVVISALTGAVIALVTNMKK